jgi:tRNA(fMet)-specific endonuclease VapC
MGRLILDTGVLVGYERSPAGVAGPIGPEDDVSIAAITAAELLVGVHRADRTRRAARQAFVDRVLDAVPVVEYGMAVARAHAELLAHTLRTGRPRGAYDLIVAATALVERRIVVTTDRRAFGDLPDLVVRVV